MYDNVNIKYEDAECIINSFNVFRVIKKLKSKISNSEAVPSDYAFLADAYDMCFFTRRAYYYALRSIKKDKNYPYAYYVAGRILYDRGKYDKALKYLLKAVKLDGKSCYYAYFYLTQTYYSLDRQKDVYEYAKKLFKVDISTHDYHLFCAILKMQLGFSVNDFSQSILKSLKIAFQKKHYYEVFRCCDVSVVMYVTRLLFLIFFRKQLRHLKIITAISLNNLSEVFSLYKNLTHKKCTDFKENISREILDEYFYNGEYKKCIALANKFLVEYKSPYVYMYKARSYDCLGKCDKAIYNLDKAKDYDKNYRDHKYFYWKAKFYFHDGKYKSAIKYLNKQILSDDIPESENYMLRGICYYDAGCFKEAEMSFLEAFGFDRDGSNRDDICWWLAHIYYVQNKFDKGLIYIDIALMENKDSYNYNLKGDILTGLKRIKEASICYDKATECGQ